MTFCSCVMLTGAASAADSLHVRLIGQYGQFTGFGVVVRGDYAYVAGQEDFIVISVVDPVHPVEVGRCSTPAIARSVDVAGDFAYVADNSGRQPCLRVISIADPANPVEVGRCSTPNELLAVAVRGDYAYVSCALIGLRVISIADPANPVEVGYWNTGGNPYHLKVDGDYVYLAAIDSGLRIISVADPTDPDEVGRYTPGEAKTVAVSGDTAYIGGWDGSFRVLCVSDPANPVEVGRMDGLGSWPEDVAIIRGHAFVAAWSSGGVRVISLSDPAHPVEVGHYAEDCWSIAVNKNYIYVGSLLNGLWILQFYQAGDLDIDPDSLGVIADTMRLQSCPDSNYTLGGFVLANTSAAYNPDTLDGPSESPVDSLVCDGSLSGPGGTIDSILMPNLPASLGEGQALTCTLAVHVPPRLQNGVYTGSVTVIGRDTAGLLVQADLNVLLTVRNRLGDLDAANDSLDVVGDTIRVRPRLVSTRPPPEYTEYALGEFLLANTSTTYNPDTLDGPSQSPVDSLRYAASLTGPGGTIDSVFIPNLPAYLAPGQTTACSLVMSIPPDLAVGSYSGSIVINGFDSLHYEVAETVYALIQKLGDLDVDDDSLDVVRDTVDLRTQPAGPVYHPYAKASFMLASTSSAYNPDTVDGPGLSLLRTVKVEAKVTAQDGSLDSVYVLNLPESLAAGQARECTLALVIPAGTDSSGHGGWVSIGAYDMLGYRVRDSFFLRVDGPQPRENLDSFEVAPIPFKPYRNPEHDAIHFQGLSAGAKVIVYDASGQSVWSATESGDGHLAWDAKVASGIYVYLVVSADGRASKVGKLSVIR